jgi:hypothetical protein
MKIRSIALAAAAVATTCAVFAEAPAHKPVAPQPAPREQTVLQDLAAGMREILRAVTPEISLPAIEIKLPTLTRG